MTFRLRLTPPIFFYCSFPCANHGRTHRARKLFFVVVVFVIVTTVIVVILAQFQSDLNTLVYIHNKHSAASQPASQLDMLMASPRLAWGSLFPFIHYLILYAFTLLLTDPFHRKLFILPLHAAAQFIKKSSFQKRERKINKLSLYLLVVSSYFCGFSNSTSLGSLGESTSRLISFRIP